MEDEEKAIAFAGCTIAAIWIIVWLGFVALIVWAIISLVVHFT